MILKSSLMDYHVSENFRLKDLELFSEQLKLLSVSSSFGITWSKSFTRFKKLAKA